MLCLSYSASFRGGLTGLPLQPKSAESREAASASGAAASAGLSAAETRLQNVQAKCLMRLSAMLEAGHQPLMQQLKSFEGLLGTIE